MGVAITSSGLIIPSGDPGEARIVRALLEGPLAANGYSEREVFAINLAIEEALVNAIKHGNRMDPDKWVRLEFRNCAFLTSRLLGHGTVVPGGKLLVEYDAHRFLVPGRCLVAGRVLPR
jgi:hypothetical protein